MATQTFVFFLLLIIITLLIGTKNAFARKHSNPPFSSSSSSSSSSLVFGLAKSRISLPTPKSQASVRLTRPQEALDLIESLREVRDGYLITLNVGTPPQAVQVYMDTGSDLIWFPCGNISFDCMDCDDYRNNKAISYFSPIYSSSSIRASCASSLCIDIHSSDNHFDPCTIAGCSISMLLKNTCSRPCPSFAYTYGEGGLVIGTLTRDILTVHASIYGAATTDIPTFSFGCVSSTYREPIGIAGFGRGSFSFLSQLGFLHKGFSHCFLPFKFANNLNVSSPLVIGDAAIKNNTSSMQFTPMLKSPLYPNYFYIGLEAITVGNGSAKQVPRELRQIDSQGNGGMLIDSGTTYTHLPNPFYSKLLETLKSTITYPRATYIEQRTGFDLCYKVSCPNNDPNNSNDNALPSITFHFLNNVDLLLAQDVSFYAMSAPSNGTVVKCMLFQSMDDGDYGPTAIFGSFQQQNVKVVYDLEKERIGFQAMDCASATDLEGL